jgi:hypothetical protein
MFKFAAKLGTNKVDRDYEDNLHNYIFSHTAEWILRDLPIREKARSWLNLQIHNNNSH